MSPTPYLLSTYDCDNYQLQDNLKPTTERGKPNLLKQVAYSYASAYPMEVKKLVVTELTISGFAPAGRMPL